MSAAGQGRSRWSGRDVPTEAQAASVPLPPQPQPTQDVAHPAPHEASYGDAAHIHAAGGSHHDYRDSYDRGYIRDNGQYDNYGGPSRGRHGRDEYGSDRRRSRSRSRSRSRDRDRGDDYRGGSRGCSSGGYREYDDRDGDRYRHGGGNTMKEKDRALHPVSSTVIIKGLPAHTTEPVMYAALAAFSPQSIRLISSRDTGECKGFAFVQFYSTEYAQYFMNAYAGSWGDPKAPQFIIENRAVALDYCRDEPPSAGGASWHQGSSHSGGPPRADWICGACSCQNFARRLECYKCSRPRGDDSMVVPAVGAQDPLFNSEAMSSTETPSATLVVKGLPPMATEAQIMEMFRQYAVVLNVLLMRDWATGVSRGIAFVEFQSVEYAAHTKSLTQQIRMGNTYLKVGFARPGYEKFFQRQPGAQIAPAWPGAAPPAPVPVAYVPMPVVPQVPVVPSALPPALTRAHPGVAALISQALPPAPTPTNNSVQQTVVAAVVQASKSSRRWPPKFETSGAAYVFQPQSGLFFESISKFYYCPKSKTYYNTASGEYFRHNGSSDPDTAFELVAAPIQAGSAEAKDSKETARSESTKEVVSDGPRKPVVISIGLGNKSKIAKPLNVQNVVAPAVSVTTTSEESVVSASAFGKASADASNISKWEERKRKEQSDDPPKPADSVVATSQNHPAASVLQPASAPVAGAPVCLLCQRQFPSLEVLARHERESKLHAENLAKAEVARAAVSSAGSSDASKYRDRAQERRVQRPSEEEINPKESRDKERSSKRATNNLSHYVPSASHSLPEDPQSSHESGVAPVSSDQANPGNQLLRRMGWNEGSGLGKDGSGSITPVAIDQEAKSLAPSSKTGVGVSSNIPSVVYGDDKTYKESLLRATRARFEQISK